MSIYRPEDLRVRWLGEIWLVETPIALSPAQLRRVADWIVSTQHDRWLSLPHGEKRDECGRTVEAARQGKIECRLLPSADGSMTVFASSRRTRPERSFHIFGGES